MSYVEIQRMIPVSKYNIKSPHTMAPKYITIHNTANDASASNEISYMTTNNNSVSYHVAIDDKEAIQAIPYNRNAWHCGDGGNGVGNRQSIGVEICYSKSGGSRYAAAEANTVDWVARKLHQFGWGMDRVKWHFDWSNKNCPHRILNEKRSAQVRNKIASRLDELRVGKVPAPSSPTPSKPSTPNTSSPSTSLGLVDYMKSKGMDSSFANRSKLANQYGIANYSGTATQNNQLLNKIIGGGTTSATPPVSNLKPASPRLAIDGHMGPLTVSALQTYFGTPVDGVISKPSLMVKKLQALVGVTQDGYMGPNTIKALQKRMKTPIDGVLSKPSMAVREIQRRLNDGKL